MKSSVPCNASISSGRRVLSVVLPVYNGGNYLNAAIDSILGQTFSDFELLVIDDGSTDNSLKILLGYEDIDNRVIVVSRENRGLVATLNELIELATGQWIARMDQDDIALPHRFERQLEWLSETGADLTGSWVQRFGTSDARVVKFRHTDEQIKTELLFDSPFAHPSVVVRANLLKALRYSESFEKAEDYGLWVRATEAGWKMTNVPEVLLLYRIHSSQITTKTVEDVKRSANHIRRIYFNHFLKDDSSIESVSDAAMVAFELNTRSIDFDAVDVMFSAILKTCPASSRFIAIDHIKRIYIRLSSFDKNISSRFQKLTLPFAGELDIISRVQFFAFRFLTESQSRALYMALKKLSIFAKSSKIFRIFN